MVGEKFGRIGVSVGVLGQEEAGVKKKVSIFAVGNGECFPQ